LGGLASRGFNVPGEAVIPFAKHEMEPIRRAAVVALGRIKDAKTIPLLIEAFNDELFSVRYPAAQALASFGDAAVEPLAELLHDADAMRQALACYALGLSNSREAYDYLISALSSPEPVVRAHAVEGLRNLGDWRIRSTLYKMRFDETDPGVLGEIEEALAGL
jgi:HEAT repeat protein